MTKPHTGSSSSSNTSTLHSKDSGLSTMSSLQQAITQANDAADLRRHRDQALAAARPMTVAEFNLAQRKKSAMSSAMHSYINVPSSIKSEAASVATDSGTGTMSSRDGGYSSAENSPQHKSEFDCSPF
jgi:hypothetical protein